MAHIAIDGNSLTLESALAIAKGTATAFLPASSREKMQDSRDAVEDVLESKNVVYGINTGFEFGSRSLCIRKISYWKSHG